MDLIGGAPAVHVPVHVNLGQNVVPQVVHVAHEQEPVIRNGPPSNNSDALAFMLLGIVLGVLFTCYLVRV